METKRERNYNGTKAKSPCIVKNEAYPFSSLASTNVVFVASYSWLTTIDFTPGVPTHPKRNGTIIERKRNDLTMLFLNQQSIHPTIVQRRQNVNFLLVPTVYACYVRVINGWSRGCIWDSIAWRGAMVPRFGENPEWNWTVGVECTR